MAGSIIVTTSEVIHNIVKYSVAWTSDASGNVNGNTFPMMVGTLVSVEFLPGAGDVQPSDLYDVDLLDAEGITMFDNGAGTSIGSHLSNLFGSHHVPLVGLTGVTIYRRWHHGGSVELDVANAGDSNSGTVNIFVAQGVF